MGMRILASVSAALAVALVYGGEAAAKVTPAAEPTFFLPFEGTCTAAKAGGAAEPTAKPRDVTYGPGVTGQAAHFGKGAGYLHFAFAGNAVAERGTVSFWYKPDAAAPDWPRLRAPIFNFDRPDAPGVFNGTGWINVLHESGNLQARFGTDKGGGEWVSSRVWSDPSWRHIAISWDREKGIVRLCVDGEECVRRGDSYNPFKPPYGKRKWSNPKEFKGFVVGGERQGGTSCAGWLDEFAIHGDVLPIADLRAAAVAHKPLAVSLTRHFAWAGGGGEIGAVVTNRSGDAVSAQAVFRSPDGAEVARREVTVPAHGAASVKANVEKFIAGRYVVEVAVPGKVGVSTEFWTLGARPTHIAEGDDLELEKVFEADFSELPPADRIVSNSDNVIGELAGRRYLETSPKYGSRFAYRVDLPTPNALYCFEWEWPDDKPRFADVIVQPAIAGHNHYELQVGYATGGPLWPISGKMQTVRQLYWASSTNCAVVLCTLKQNEPAAVASLKVHRVKGDALPAARRAREVPRAADGGRPFGIYFEDPAIGLCFDIAGIGGDMPGFEDLVNRTVAYLKHTGQNFMSYPGVWYHGVIGKDYQPRAHMMGFLEAWYERFDHEGFGFMPSVNLHTIPFTPHVPVTAENVADGTFNGTCADIVDDGAVASKWHHQPPTYNGLHARVQAEIDRMVDVLLAEGAPHPSFKGIDFYFHTAHDLPWLGTIHAGYNDWAIDAFSRDTGIKPPVDRADPARGRKYAEWLKANAYEPWVAWRCKMFAAWVRRMAKRVAAARSDLQLCITAQSLIEYEKQDPATPHLQRKLMREGALDSELLADVPNLVLRLGCRPLGPQTYRGKTSARKEELLLMNAEYDAEYWEPLKAAREPQLNIHDHYYESAMGSKTPLKAPWFRETGWRVCAINPLGRNAMKAYIDPFRYDDVLGITRGGFLIATYGLEPMIVPFAKAYTALPRKRFKDVESCSTDVVKVRRLSDGGRNWVYAVNTGAEPAKVSLPCGKTQVVDLATGLPAKEWRDGRLELSLAPYEFRAFVR